MDTLPTLSVPKYYLTIPSTKEKVSYRPYLVREEKILMIASESEDPDQIQDAVIDVISKCLDYNKDIKDLTPSDLEYIFIQLRSKSVGEKVEIIKVCGECDHNNKVTINLDNIVVENQEENLNSNLKLSDDLTLEVKFPTLRTENPDHGDETDTEILINAAANSLSLIFYGEDTYDASSVSLEERKEFIGNLNSEQFNKIISYLMKAPLVAYHSDFTCTKCGNKEEFSYTGLIDFFI